MLLSWYFKVFDIKPTSNTNINIKTNHRHSYLTPISTNESENPCPHPTCTTKYGSYPRTYEASSLSDPGSKTYSLYSCHSQSLPFDVQSNWFALAHYWCCSCWAWHFSMSVQGFVRHAGWSLEGIDRFWGCSFWWEWWNFSFFWSSGCGESFFLKFVIL